MVDWKHYGTLSFGERRKFLKENGLQYRNVPTCKVCHHVFFNCKCNDEEYHKKIERGMQLLKAPVRSKVQHSMQLAKQVMEEHRGEKIYLAYSGGIDSECCVQLFRNEIMKGEVKVIVGDTLVAFPESRERWSNLEKELNQKILFTRPERGISFKTIVREYGLPIHSRSSNDKTKRRATIRCCSLLKKQPMKKVTKDVDVLIMGLRAEENRNRKLGILNKGDYFYSKSNHSWRVYPIAYWSIEDVWKFQEYFGFRYSAIYDKTNCGRKGFYKLKNGKFYQIRTGCWCCPQAIRTGYLEWLKEHYPKFYKVLLFNFGLAQAIIKLNREKGNHKNLPKPCEL